MMLADAFNRWTRCAATSKTIISSSTTLVSKSARDFGYRNWIAGWQSLADRVK